MKYIHRKNRSISCIWHLALCICLSLLSSCGSDSDTSEETTSDTGDLSFGLKWESPAPAAAMNVAKSASGNICVDYAIDRIRAAIYDSSNTEVGSGSWPCTDNQGTIGDVPAESGMRLVVEGAVSGTFPWRGEETDITVSAEQPTYIEVTMKYFVGFTAYNDLAWATDQPNTNITTITSPNGGSGQPNSGNLMDFSTGNGTDIWLEVTGGSFNGTNQATQVSGSPDCDACDVFNGKLDAMGSISWVDQPSPEGDLVLTFSKMDPGKTYTLVSYGHRNEYGWDRASLVTISGADDFTNQSSDAGDNPRDDCVDGSGRIFCGPDDVSTRLPADNDIDYVARFAGIDPGDDGEVVLTISWDGTPGSEDRGKYANAVMLMEESSFTAYNDLAWATGQLDQNITMYTSPNGGSSLTNSGELLNFADGTKTGVTLTVTGGDFNGTNQATELSGSPQAGDACDVFCGKLDAMGSISWVDQPSPEGDLVLTFSGMDPDKTYTLVFYGYRNEYGWDRASLVTISGADDFTNQSSDADDNPRDDCVAGSGRIFCGPNDDSTRLPADNDHDYVVRFTGIDPGIDGEVVLTISWDGTPGSEGIGKYANAVMLMEER